MEIVKRCDFARKKIIIGIWTVEIFLLKDDER